MPLAIFDLDNTLIGGDSDYLWGEFLCDEGIITNYNREGFELKGKVSIFNTSHKYNNKGIIEKSYELHEADSKTVKLWKEYA